MSLPVQFIDELRSRILLSSLIAPAVKLTKAGREFKGLCPFHSEKTPSFTVNDEKGFYHCFSCSAHGDALRARGLQIEDVTVRSWTLSGRSIPARYWTHISAIADANDVPFSIEEAARSVAAPIEARA